MSLMTIVYLIAGLVLLVAGAEVLVRGAGKLAAQFGIPPLIIGLTVVAFGTSAPETAVSVQAALEHEGGEAAHEPLAAHQQLGREPEIARANPFERADAHRAGVGEIVDRSVVAVHQRSVDTGKARLLQIEQQKPLFGIDGRGRHHGKIRLEIGDELQRIGYAGTSPCPSAAPHAFVELHIEQGPRLEAEGVQIGAVTGVQGISWQEVTIAGQSNHAGTTPMSLRHDPAYIAAEIAVYLRQIAREYGGNQVCTVGKIDLQPNLINVVPKGATLTLDVRNTDEKLLCEVEAKIAQKISELAEAEGVTISSRVLARFEPVDFDDQLTDLIVDLAQHHNRSVMLMPSGAGHDAQMLARVCPTTMIFTPSVQGISHNPAEFTHTEDLIAGTNILMDTMWALAHVDLSSQTGLK